LGKAYTYLRSEPAKMAARPQVSVEGGKAQIELPHVFLSPIRPDIVQFVHTNMRKNARQAYAVKTGAGHQHSAESWGTGRAVSRIPRVSGGGTSRAGQGAFGNMCRKGRMFAPTRVWRRWHRRINSNQRRYATASALAATALPSLVMARGHRISEIAEIPCVVGNEIEALQKTRQAIAALKATGAYDDVEKVKTSRKLRPGKGKMRNRRHVHRLGPLIVYNQDQGLVKAFRNLPGVDLAQVERLNLLQLAPGGHMGRFIIWTKSAFERLNDVYGSVDSAARQKKGYTLPRNIMGNSDLTRLINSDEVQTVVRPIAPRAQRIKHKKNPLKNLGVLVRLNPYALSLRRAELLHQRRIAAGKETSRAVTHQSTAHRKANYKRINHDDEPAGEEHTEKPKETAETSTAPAPKAAAAPPAKKQATGDY